LLSDTALTKDIKPYPSYKDSGLPWLGEVPVHWDVRRNKLFLREVNERSKDGSEDLLTVSQYTGVTRRRERVATEGALLTNAESLVGYKLVKPNDLVMNIMLAWNGSLGISAVEGIASPAYSVFRANKEIEPWFLHYLFRTPLFTGSFKTVSTGVVDSRLRLYPEVFSRLPSLLPPKDEQSAIVRFLDHADRRIRRFIRVKRQMIGLLNEQKQAIILHAVTRGLDAGVRLKPSGVEWLRDVPEHWEVISVGAATSLLQTGPFGSQLHSHEYVTSGTPVINPSHMKDGRIIPDPAISVSLAKMKELERHRVRVGDIVAARRGELGRCAVVTPVEEGWLCGTGSLLIRCKVSIFEPTYFQLVFASQGIRDSLSLASIGATMDNLNAGMVARLRMPLPPIAEQHQIIEVVKAEYRHHEITTSTIQREIDLIREYRTRLITDVVTGKLDVRGVAVEAVEEELDELLDADDVDLDEMDAEMGEEGDSDEK
jgi:type I restriction enzyme S subunit